MKTLNQYAESLMIALKQVTDESYLSGKEDWLKDKIKDIRTTLAREEYHQDRAINPEFYSKLDLPIECDVKVVSLGKVSITSDIKLSRVKLPPLLQGIGNPIKYFGDDNILSTGFSFASLSGLASSDAAIYTSMKPSGARIGTFLYLKNIPTGMSNITVIAALNDPTDNLNYSDDDSFPVPSGYKIELLAKKDILAGWNIPLDVTENENDDSIPNTKNMQNVSRSNK